MWYVYEVTDNLNNMAYIGCSKDPYKRFSQHCGKYKTRSYNAKLTAAIHLYGVENFTLSVIGSFDVRRDAYDFESKAIADRGTQWPTGYNMVAKNLPSHYRHSDDVKTKLSEINVEGWNDPELRIKRSKGMVEAWKNEDSKELRKAAMKTAWENDDGSRRAKLKTRWDDPAFRERHRQAIILSFERRGKTARKPDKVA